MKIVVDNSADIRLDKYLTNNTDYSRTYINKMLEKGYILVNGKTSKNSYIPKMNDVIEIDESFEKQSDLLPVKMDLDILYEDDDIMVINKPSGLVVHPGSGNYNNTLVNGLMDYTNNLSDINGKERFGIVHRLDKDTSGLMLIAKSNKAHQILADDFKNHNVKRTYFALLKGVLPYNNATIDVPIKRDSNNFNKMGAFADGKKAVTHLTVIKRYQNYTLVKLNLETGRTHQIRVHMKYIGFPIYNDPLYNNDNASEFGQFLHSKVIDFKHPITKENMNFEVDLPKEFQSFIDNLK